jgi:Spy/CpxP family protein refolding chaperone
MSAVSDPPRRNVALIVSICVNLVLAGIIAMAVFRFQFRPPLIAPIGGHSGPVSGPLERQQVRQLMSPRLLMRVAPDKRGAIRDIAQPYRHDLDGLRDASAAARREVVRLYTAPVYDKAAVERALAKMQAADSAFELKLTKVATEAGGLLTPEERQAVIAWQPRGFHGSGGRHGHGDGFGRGDDGQPPPPQP